MAVVNYTVLLGTGTPPTVAGVVVIGQQSVTQFKGAGVTLPYPGSAAASTPSASVFPTANSATAYPKRP